MAFVKLDTGILDSTLWPERDARELFITALLMAEPRELTEENSQLQVDSLEPTGFVVPPGWYGFVRAAGIGIIRRSGMNHDVGMKALRDLGNPDSESRSSEFEGRRLVRVNGGFVVLNYVKYRDRDATTAERSRRWRQRQKELKEQQSGTVTQRRDATETDTRRHQAEAEAEAEAEELQSSKAVRITDHGKKSQKQHGTAALHENFQPAHPEYRPSEYADWIAIKNHLRKDVGEQSWEHWLRPMYLLKALNGKHFLLALPPSISVVQAARANRAVIVKALQSRGYDLAGFTKYPSEFEMNIMRPGFQKGGKKNGA